MKAKSGMSLSDSMEVKPQIFIACSYPYLHIFLQNWKKSPIKAMKLNKAIVKYDEKLKKIISSFYFWAWILFIALNLRFFISNSTCSIQIVYIHQTQAHTQTHVQFKDLHNSIFNRLRISVHIIFYFFLYIFKNIYKKYIYK